MKVDRLAGIASSAVVAVAHVSADGVSILRSRSAIDRDAHVG